MDLKRELHILYRKTFYFKWREIRADRWSYASRWLKESRICSYWRWKIKGHFWGRKKKIVVCLRVPDEPFHSLLWWTYQWFRLLHGSEHHGLADWPCQDGQDYYLHHPSTIQPDFQQIWQTSSPCGRSDSISWESFRGWPILHFNQLSNPPAI